MTYRQNTDVFLRNATSSNDSYAILEYAWLILQYANLENAVAAASDGYHLHVDWQPDDSIETYDTYDNLLDVNNKGSYDGRFPDYMNIVDNINFDTPTWQGEVYGVDLKQALDTAKTFCRPVDTRSYDDSSVTLRIVPASARNEPAEVYVSSKNEEGDVVTVIDAKQLSRIVSENEPLEIKLNWRYLNQARIGLDQYGQDSKIKITYNGAEKPLALGERGKRLVVIMPIIE